MKKINYVDEDFLLLERPNIREECNINNDDEMNNYLNVYNSYNDLLIQFLSKKYYLKNVDEELEKKKDTYPEVPSSEKDLYQTLSSGYLKYFYLRNNIYVERLTKEEVDYLLAMSNSGNLELTPEIEKFINDTYLRVILENPNEKGVNINYGPDNFKYYKPSNAIVIGVRYNQFQNLSNDEGALDDFMKTKHNIFLFAQFLEYKVKLDTDISFCVIEYDEFSVHKKTVSNVKRN